jgi:hypothetical protein
VEWRAEDEPLTETDRREAVRSEPVGGHAATVEFTEVEASGSSCPTVKMTSVDRADQERASIGGDPYVVDRSEPLLCDRARVTLPSWPKLRSKPPVFVNRTRWVVN